MTQGINSPKPTTSEIVGGVYNVTPPVLVDGQAAALQVDVNGKLITSGSGGGGNVNITGINSSPPALSNPLPVELSDGTNPVGTAGNPLSVNVITGGGSNASVGVTGVVAPTSATEIGVIDGTGKLQGASASNPVRVDPTGTTTQPVSGAVTANAGTNLNTSALALDATLTGGSQKTKIVDTGGANVASVSAAGAVKVDGSAVTQPVSGTVTANQGTNNATPWNENIAQWGGTAVAAPATTAPVGTEAAPIVREIFTKRGQILTTTPLAGAATFTSAWFDSNTDGTVFVSASATSDHGNSTSGTFLIEMSDDSSNALFTVTGASNSWPPGVVTTISCAITRRYWRVRALNGATPNTTQEITAVSTGIPIQPLVGIDTVGVPHSIVTTSNGVLALPWTTGIADSYGQGTGVPNIVSQTTVLPSGTFLCSGANGVGLWTAQRYPNIFKTASVVATATGNSAVWTPAAGKKFRIMRFQITAQGLGATASAAVTVSFQDNVTGITIGTYDVDVPVTANVVSGVTQVSGGWIDIGNGFLSAAANNVLNFNISAAGAATTGTYRINVCGTEE